MIQPDPLHIVQKGNMHAAIAPKDYTLIGPFSEVLTFKDAPLKGPLSEKDLSLIKYGGIVVSIDGTIVAVGDFASLKQQYLKKDCRYFPIEGEMVLLPGFVDAHTHILFGGTRARDYSMRLEGKTYLEIAQAGGGIMDTVLATRSASDENLMQSMQKRLQKMLFSGVTTTEVKSGYGLNINQEWRLLKILKRLQQTSIIDVIPTCLAAHMKPPDYPGMNSDYLAALQHKLLPLIKADQLAKRIDIFVEDSAFNVAEAKGYLTAAKQAGFDITVHADQFTPGGARLAAQLGACSADHLEASTDRDIQLLAASETVATVLPGASLGLGIPFAPARRLLDAGAAVAIASDWNPGSAPMGDLLTSTALISVYEKLHMAEALAGITFRAAKALGLTDRGRLKVGSLADMQAYPTGDYRDILYYQGQLRPAIIWKKSISYDQ